MDDTITKKEKLQNGPNKTNCQTDLRGEFLQAKEEIESIGRDWDELFACAKDAPTYFSRAWIQTFINHNRFEGKPCFIVVWNGSKLVALLSLSVRSICGIRIGCPIGMNEPSYLGLLLDPKYPEAIAVVAETWIREKVAHAFHNKYLSLFDKATQELLIELKKHGFIYHQGYNRISHCIELGCSFDEYFKKKTSSKSRQNLLRRERRLFERANVRVEHYAAGEVIPEVLLRIAAVEEKSWLKRRGVAVLQKPFYQKILLKMAQAGIGHVWLMTIDGEDAAFEYVFISHKRLQFGWRAFNLKYTSSDSIGQILMMHAIRDACNNGILSMDIGLGEAEYKRFWADPAHSVSWVVAGRGFPGRIVILCYRTAWWLAGQKKLFQFYRRLKNYKKRITHSPPSSDN